MKLPSPPSNVSVKIGVGTPTCSVAFRVVLPTPSVVFVNWTTAEYAPFASVAAAA